MRWLIRRTVFYAFALWVAITLNFLLPRLMPGDPAGGVLQRLSSSQLASNPGLIQTYRDLLGGPKQALLPAYWDYLGRVVTFNFGISTTNYPTKVSTVIGQTLPYSIFLVGVGFVLAFVFGITVGMVAAWRRGGAVDNIVVPTMLSISAFPAFFTSLVAVYVLGLKLGWFPLGHAYATDLQPGFNYTFLESAFRHAQLPILIIMLAFAGGWVLNMRTVMINTIEEDYVSMALAKGVSDRRAMTALCGPERDPAAAERLRRPVRDGGRRPRLHRVRLQLPGRGTDARAGRPRQRLPADAGAAARVRRDCVIAANFIMDLLNLVLDPRVRAS